MDHYERLGVRRSADRGEIRAAYLQRAKALHPDRHADDAPASRERVEAQMRAVNEAWSVLGDAGRRSDYDRELARQARRDAPEPVFHPVSEARFDDEDDAEFEPIGREGMLLRVLPLLVLLAILFFILVFTAYAAAPRS
jgi:curved DNA-binding protein CbpA